MEKTASGREYTPGCQYGNGACQAIGCQLLAALKELDAIRDREGYQQRRDELILEAQSKGCCCNTSNL